MNDVFEQLTSSLLDLLDEATEFVTVDTVVGVMIHQPSKGPDMEEWPHLAIATAGRDIAPSTEAIGNLFAENAAVLGKLESKNDHLFKEENIGLVYDVTTTDDTPARVVLSVIPPEGKEFSIDEEWFIHVFALAINSLLRGSENSPIATHVYGHLYAGGPLHDDEIEYKEGELE
ncbi:hypothetical protein J6X15_01830 [Candidatus Saccharibacteria bacterium]|nr:hypothetical protein [Candidatus Saccharibacteria bacterium]